MVQANERASLSMNRFSSHRSQAHQPTVFGIADWYLRNPAFAFGINSTSEF